MYYRLRRHVLEIGEVWGIDRPAPHLETTTHRDTDKCDPLGNQCALLLVYEGQYVTWPRFFEWLSYAETKGYTLVTPFADLSPYSTLVIKY